MITDKTLDFDNMQDALDILMEFSNKYNDVEKQSVLKGTEFIAYEKGFLRKRKPVANLKVELIENFDSMYVNPNFDDQYLKFTMVDKYTTKEFISNYGCIKSFVIEFRADTNNQINSDGFLGDYDTKSILTVTSELLSTAKKYEDLLKWIDVFDK